MSRDRDEVLSAAADVEAVSVWLAGAAARPLFNVASQTAEDLIRWERIQDTRRREEWEVSRALLAHVRAQVASLRHISSPAEDRGPGTPRSESSSPVPDTAPAAARSSSSLPGSVPPPDGMHLSLSHSGGHAAVAMSRPGIRVGVDLESSGPRDVTRLARFAFTEAEHAQLAALSGEARDERFYILWTLKEAFAKALSLPLLASLRQCTFVEEHGAWRSSVPTTNEWAAEVFRVSSTLVLSVVAVLPTISEKTISPGNFSVFAHEWPEPAARPWRPLARLRSGRG